LVRAQDS